MRSANGHQSGPIAQRRIITCLPETLAAPNRNTPPAFTTQAATFSGARTISTAKQRGLCARRRLTRITFTSPAHSARLAVHHGL